MLARVMPGNAFLGMFETTRRHVVPDGFWGGSFKMSLEEGITSLALWLEAGDRTKPFYDRRPFDQRPTNIIGACFNFSAWRDG